MIETFRQHLSQSFSSEAQLDGAVSGLSAFDWQPVADLFAMRLPEFDAVYALPGAEQLGAEIAQARGVPEVSRSGWPGAGGEVLILSAQLKDGQAEEAVFTQARDSGWQVALIAAAVEYTSLGGRARLHRHDVPVRAAAQVATTPGGLIFERRAPERWNH
ncbi:hypothetical protein [Deinococcus fonticola]|uniref:hypothetical protein n=1 Tax=Deinococcus fonticola TaxID=2528713 RepID=UPI0010754861|nr:hypothetical protein [Deinococcus fonticola]